MDRNTIIGLVLIVGIVLTFAIINSSGEEDTPRKPLKTQVDSLPPVQDTPPVDLNGGNQSLSLQKGNLPDSVFNKLTEAQQDSVIHHQDSVLKESRRIQEFGYFSEMAEGEDKVIRVVTDKLEFDLHTKGGVVRPMILREYKTYDSLPLPLLTDSENNYMALDLSHNYGTDSKFPVQGLLSKDLYLKTDYDGDEIKLSGSQSKTIRFRGAVDNAHYFEFVYTLYGDSYDYGFKVNMVGMEDLLPKGKAKFDWAAAVPKTEKSMQLMRDKTAVYYRQSEEVDNLTERSTEPEKEELSDQAVDWVAFKSQFFSQTFMVDEGSQGLANVVVTQNTPAPTVFDDPNSGEVVRNMGMSLTLPIVGSGSLPSYNFTVVNAPLEFDLLDDYDRDLTRQIALGWGPLKYINIYMVIPIFNFLEGSIASYGIIILILALLIKLLLYPLTFRTYISSAKMRIINKTPEIKALEEKYKDDSTKLQQEKMKIYRSMGANMFGGCLPMLLQYPFLISLFFLFPNLIELRQQGFLWADDLSTYDSILELGFNIPFYGDHVSLFTLLMTVSIFIYTIINQQMQGSTVNNPVMKYFPYIMPLIFLGFLNNYSSGLSWYYLVSNIISITQAQVSKAFINEEALLEKMRSTAKEKKKKGGSQSRLEKWAEKQQQKQKEIQKSRSGRQGGGGNGRGGGRGKRR